MSVVGLLLATLFAAPAQAQQPFSLDAVLVAEFDSEEPLLEIVAAELHRSVEARLATEFLVVPFDTVPPYSDYSASVYLQSCAEGQYVGCAFVLGGRANANWVVAGEIGAGFRDGPPEALFSIIDVEESRPVVTFSSVITPDNHASVGDGVALVLSTVIAGAHEEGDIRGEVEGARAAWERRRAEARAAAEELAFADQDLQILIRPDRGGFDDRLTAADLEQYEGREEGTPWEDVGMGRQEYLRYRNSGRSLEGWRALSQGRQGELLVSVGAGFGGGPYRNRFDGRWVIDAETLQPIASGSLQQMDQGPVHVFDIDLAFGILPTVDVGVGIATRSVRFNWYYQRELGGSDFTEQIAEGETFRYTTEYRVRGTWAPFPTFPVRPTATAGFAWWQGSAIDRVVRVDGPVEALEAPAFLFLHVGPGVEVSPNPNLQLFARFTTELLLNGGRTETRVSGQDAFREPPEPKPLGLGAGTLLTLGVTGRLRLLGTPVSGGSPGR